MNICEVDVFEGYTPCDRPGVVTYRDSDTEVLLCVEHSIQLASAGERT